jgi:hypothetical protein
MICLCCPPINFVCELHRSGRAETKCPWNPDDLPDRLRGFGHRMADQDGGSGEEWVTPQEDFEAQMIEAARLLLDAVEIEVAEGL